MKKKNGPPFPGVPADFSALAQGAPLVTLEDLPEVPNPLGGLVLDKSAEDMDFYLESGYFPPDGDDEDEQPVRRRESRDRDRDDAPRRRTPGRRGDVY